MRPTSSFLDHFSCVYFRTIQTSTVIQHHRRPSFHQRQSLYPRLLRLFDPALASREIDNERRFFTRYHGFDFRPQRDPRMEYVNELLRSFLGRLWFLPEYGLCSCIQVSYVPVSEKCIYMKRLWMKSKLTIRAIALCCNREAWNFGERFPSLSVGRSIEKRITL